MPPAQVRRSWVSSHSALSPAPVQVDNLGMGNERTSQNSHGRAQRCTRCADVLAEIDMVIDGDPLVMRSCSTCDTRSWHRYGVATDLATILADLAQTDRRYKRDLATATRR